MKVSIIIPVYNGALYLAATIENALQQTYPDKEIIVVDDASTDNSLSIARQYEALGVKIITQKNSGAAVARNTGLLAASGKYIQFLDTDDFLSADKIEKQVESLQGREDKVAVCNYHSFVKDEELKTSIKVAPKQPFIYSTDTPADFLINLWGARGVTNFIQTNCWLVPRKVIDKAGLWRAYRCPDDDGEFFARVLLASQGVVFVPGVINYYRRQTSPDKLSANPKHKYVQNTLLTIDLKYSYMKNRVGELILRKAFAKQWLDFAVYNYPVYPVLSKIAMKKYKALNTKACLPLLGGRMIEFVKNTLGWKAARLIKNYFS